MATPSAAPEQPTVQFSATLPAAQPSMPLSAPSAAVPAATEEVTAESAQIPPIGIVPSGTAMEGVTREPSLPAQPPQSRTLSPNPPSAIVALESSNSLGLRQSLLFVVIGTPIGALLVFLAVRGLALRARRR